MVEQITYDARARWINTQGLMNLHPGHTSKPDNLNGILYMAYFICLLYKLSPTEALKFRDEILKTILKLEEKPGLYNRTVTDPHYQMQQADDYVGILYLSELFDLPFSMRIAAYGHKNGWMFNNVPPYEYKIQALRQPGEIAFYKVIHHESPPLWEMLWLCVGHLTSDSYLLQWLREETIQASGAKSVLWEVTKWLRKTYRKSVIDYLDGYFQEKQHPILRLARLYYS